MIRLITTALLLFELSISIALAQSQTFKNSNGQIIGRSVTNNAGTQFYDASGRNTGRSTTNNAGTTFYDASGRQTGSARRR